MIAKAERKLSTDLQDAVDSALFYQLAVKRDEALYDEARKALAAKLATDETTRIIIGETFPHATGTLRLSAAPSRRQVNVAKLVSLVEEGKATFSQVLHGAVSMWNASNLEALGLTEALDQAPEKPPVLTLVASPAFKDEVLSILGSRHAA